MHRVDHPVVADSGPLTLQRPSQRTSELPVVSTDCCH